MKNEPVICIGHQPNGFFPKRFFVTKIENARDLQKKIGGQIVFFYHDSDADYRETLTIFQDLETNKEARLNFLEENKIQKKYSPLYAKKIASGWQEETVRRLPRFMSASAVNMFSSIKARTVGEFCLEMYEKMGLFDGITVMRSSDTEFRKKALDLETYYADIEYEGEVVRAEMHEGALRLHHGGGKYFNVPAPAELEKSQMSPGRDDRFAWMQSVIQCTHYISGFSEYDYIKKEEFPEVTFILRTEIDKPEYAYLLEA